LTLIEGLAITLKNRRGKMIRKIFLFVFIFNFMVKAQEKQEKSEEELLSQARQHFDQGSNFFKQGNFRAALTEYESAYKLVPKPVVLLSIADCYQYLGEYKEAVIYLKRYIKEKPDAQDIDQVKQRIKTLESKPGLVTIHSEPEGALIIIDGQKTELRTPQKIELSPGRHKLSFILKGYKKAFYELDVEFASQVDIFIPLEEKVVKRPDIKLKPWVPEVSVKEAVPRKNLPLWITAGLTGVAVVAGTILGFAALNDLAEYEINPTKELADRGERLALASDLSWTVAGVGLITSVLLYHFYDKKKTKIIPIQKTK
jgi:tetratricopeptide (TPR) repeat protein